MLMRVPGGRFDSDACSNSGKNDLRYSLFCQIFFEVGIRECAPGFLDHCMIAWLLI